MKYIYLLTNNITKQNYIGIRECDIKPYNDKYKAENTVIRTQLKKYGKKNFSKRVLCECISEKAEKEFFEEALRVFKAISIEELNKGGVRKGVNSGAKNTHARKVICLNTKEVFDTLSEASIKTNTNRASISMACSSKSNRVNAGKDSEGNFLNWMYYDEYVEKFGEINQDKGE
jgi:hypothetical protein